MTIDPVTISPATSGTAPETQGHSARSFAYIFLDESGNFDFSANGTRYFLLTSVSMRRPFGVYAELENYKYDCIENGGDVEHFHCHDDRKAVRNEVFGVIGAHLDEMRIDCLVVEKRKTRPPLQEDERLYRWSLGFLLRRVLSCELVSGASGVMVITDTIPVNRKRKAAEKAIHGAVVGNQMPGMKYRILHHQSRSHYGLQVADYCCWAIFRKWQRGESAWYDRIKPALRSELNVFEAETQHYY